MARQNTSYRTLSTLFRTVFTVIAVSLIFGCGGGADPRSSGSSTPPSSSNVITVKLEVVNKSTAQSVQSIRKDFKAQAKATLLNSTNQPIANSIVTFSVDPNYLVLSPSTGTALTDAKGVAVIDVLLSPTTAGGATTIKAAANVGSTSADASVAISVAAAAAAGTDTLALQLLDDRGQSKTTIATNEVVTATTRLLDANGAPVVGAIVSYQADSAFVQLVPGTGTALTDAKGEAQVLLTQTPNAVGGATTIKAATTINNQTLNATANLYVKPATSPAAQTKDKLTVTLVDSNSNRVTNLQANSTATIKVNLVSATNAPLANRIVAVSTNPDLAAISPATGTVLTDSQGNATAVLQTSSTNSGAAEITASAAGVDDAKIAYSVSSADIVFGNVSVTPATISAYGTTAITAQVLRNGVAVPQPVALSFTSSCTAQAKAIIDNPSPLTANGSASVTYRDNGCAATDTVTIAIVGTTQTKQVSVNVGTPQATSLQFLGASSSTVAISGMGTTAFPEVSTLRFALRDAAGSPLGNRVVNFTVNTNTGGASISAVSATTDAASGEVTVNLQSGSLPTQLRVTATYASGSTTLTAQSNVVVVSSGIPTQNNFSLSADKLNIEGADYDGVQSVITARMADRFGNPVLDGTVVNFVTNGGAIQPSCITSAGQCSVNLNSQASRPVDGRVAVLAYAEGEESFTDLNGNGRVDAGERTTLLGGTTSIGDAFLDTNFNGIRDANEPYFKYNPNEASGAYVSPASDSGFKGPLCNSQCNGQTRTYVFKQLEIDFSGSKNARLTQIDPAPGAAVVVPSTGSCTQYITVRISDERNNPLPAGTAVSVSVPAANAAYSATISPAIVGSETTRGGSVHVISLSTAVCPGSAGDGSLSVSYITPRGNTTGQPFVINYTQ